MCESYVQPYSKPCSSASRISSTKRLCGGSGRTVTPKVSIRGGEILSAVGDRADAEDDGHVCLRDAVVERPAPRVHLETGRLEQRRQLRLPGGEQKNALP